GEDPLSSALRELKEETGLDAIPIRLRGVVTVNTGEDVGVGLYIFQGEYGGGDLTESPEGRLEWVSPFRLESLALVEDLPTLLQKVLGADAATPPFSAQYSYDETGKLFIRFSE
ncbi:MAG: hypothetical protein PHQ40_08835, partial [Anaerolineaceae bacterium]|nr:hypothetical protein [Anaerolineaceae bacterium]